MYVLLVVGSIMGMLFCSNHLSACQSFYLLSSVCSKDATRLCGSGRLGRPLLRSAQLNIHSFVSVVCMSRAEIMKDT